MTRLAPYAAAASSVLILWHAARDTPASVAFAPAPLIYPHAPAGGAPPSTPAKAAVQGGPAAPAVQTGSLELAQQASVGATIEVVVGRNDTPDANIPSMTLNPPIPP